MKEVKGVKYYMDEEKMSIIQEYLNSGKSMLFTQSKYGLRGKSIIAYWMKKFGLQDNCIFVKQKKIEMELLGKTDLERTLEKRVIELEQQLDNEKLRVVLLDKVIEIAERELNISIKKKSGVRLLKK